MATPIYLHNWKPNRIISSREVAGEFLNIYNVLNGGIDNKHIKDNSITTHKLVDDSITDIKIKNVSANKIIGKLDHTQLPDDLLRTTGGRVSDTLTFTTAAGTPLLRNYTNGEVPLLEAGTGEDKVRLTLGGDALMRLYHNDKVVWEITKDGTEVPTHFRIPVEQ